MVDNAADSTPASYRLPLLVKLLQSIGQNERSLVQLLLSSEPFWFTGFFEASQPRALFIIAFMTSTTMPRAILRSSGWLS